MPDAEDIAETFDELAEANRERAEGPDDDVNADHAAGAADAYADAASYVRRHADDVDDVERRPNAQVLPPQTGDADDA